MAFLKKEQNNQYTVVVTDPSQYTTLTGEGLVGALCSEVSLRGVCKSFAENNLENQIDAFNNTKGLPEVVAIIEGLSGLSGNVYGQGSLRQDFPIFSIVIPQEMKDASDQAKTDEAARIAREEENTRMRLQEEENLRIAAEAAVEQRLQIHKSHFNGDNRTQVNYYAKAYNYYVQNNILNTNSFTNAFNNKLFALEGDDPKVERITEEQGIKLFDALHSLFNGQNIDIYSDQTYRNLIEDEAVLNAGNIENFCADTQARVDAVCAFADRQVAVEPLAGVVQEAERNRNPEFQSQVETSNNQYQVVVQNNQPPAAIKNLDYLFSAFNNDKDNFKDSVKNLIKSDVLQNNQEDQAVDKIYGILSHFAVRNNDGRISEAQIEMLKNNRTFIDWFCSILPGFIQKINAIGDCAKRYEITKFEKHLKSAQTTLTH